MSIRAHIRALEAAGRLKRYTSPGRKPNRRRLFITECALDDLTNPQSAINLLALRGQIEADLNHWVIGGRVYALNRKPRFLKRLQRPPHEVWEIRVTEPRVQVRIFCRFAEPDTIIANKIYTRGLLGKKNSQQWKEAIKECEDCWNTLFPNFDPFSGTSIHDYVGENCDDFPI